jgi:hypothetical protein
MAATKKNHGVTDPYTDWFVDAPPPTPGPLPAGDRSLLRFKVPAENTSVDLGYGSPTPGIRMSTDHHAHITTTEAPTTTISLGAPMDGSGAPGLLLQTMGEKTEIVEKDVVETYKAQKSEHVTGAWTETCDHEKTETVAGTVTETFGAEHTWDVSKKATHTFHDDVEVVVKGHRSENIAGNTSHFRMGKFYSVTVGPVNDATLAEKGAMVVGLNAAVNLGGALSFTSGLQAAMLIGRKVEYLNGPALSITTTVKLARDNVSSSVAVAKFDRCKLSARNVDGVITSDGKADLSKSTAKIVASEFCIFK